MCPTFTISELIKSIIKSLKANACLQSDTSQICIVSLTCRHADLHGHPRHSDMTEAKKSTTMHCQERPYNYLNMIMSL